MNPANLNQPAAPEFFSPQVSAARRFYLDLKPSGKIPLAVVCGGVEYCTADYAIRRTTFPYHSIEFVVRGRGALVLAGKPCALQPGRVFSYGPGIPHEITTENGETFVKYFVDFSGTGARALLRTCGFIPGRVAQVFPPHGLQVYFDELIRCGLKNSSHSPALCAKLLEALALKIAESRAPLAGAETLAFATFQNCRGYITQHYRRLKTLAQIAAECRVNSAYLCRLFQRYDHQSPYQFLLRLKMNFAAELLQQPGALVKQVAEQAGFGDPFHFSRAFKSVFGLAPDAFRRIR